jgi:hypothetical protein
MPAQNDNGLDNQPLTPLWMKVLKTVHERGKLDLELGSSESFQQRRGGSPGGIRENSFITAQLCHSPVIALGVTKCFHF